MQGDEDSYTCDVRVVHLNRVNQARDSVIPERDMDRLADTYKALGDPTRLKILTALQEEEMCVCDLAAFLYLSESAVSHQLRRLKDLALVRYRREGKILYYSLDDDHVAALLKVGLEHVLE
jgi:DNA-binding transcriptional ArsR family regulator